MEHAQSADSIVVQDATRMGHLNWEANREKISSLYRVHSVKEIKKVMEDGGFFAR
jgi:hypothetical protein